MNIADPKTVLLVEDEDSVLLVLQESLTQCGWRVLSASNGLDALALYEVHQEGVDILVTDVEMPGLNGLALAKQLLRKRPDLSILFISAGTNTNPLTTMLACPNHGFLQKPFMLADFHAKLKRLLA